MHRVCEPEEIPFNILERYKDIIATVKLVLFLCLGMYHALSIRIWQWYTSIWEVTVLNCVSFY